MYQRVSHSRICEDAEALKAAHDRFKEKISPEQYTRMNLRVTAICKRELSPSLLRVGKSMDNKYTAVWKQEIKLRTHIAPELKRPVLSLNLEKYEDGFHPEDDYYRALSYLLHRKVNALVTSLLGPDAPLQEFSELYEEPMPGASSPFRTVYQWYAGLFGASICAGSWYERDGDPQLFFEEVPSCCRPLELQRGTPSPTVSVNINFSTQPQSVRDYIAQHFPKTHGGFAEIWSEGDGLQDEDGVMKARRANLPTLAVASTDSKPFTV